MKLIPLTQGYVAVVDDADYGRVVSEGKWSAHVRENQVYAACRFEGGYVLLHRFILGITDPKIHVDHVNHYGMDNRRDNLRVCSRSQNLANSRQTIKKKTSSQYRGVSKRNRKWFARIKVNGKAFHLGVFANEADAARAYDDAAREHFGEFANYNFKIRRLAGE